MRNEIYQRLIEHVARRQWVDANETFRAILEQKVALRIESEKKLLVEPEDDEEEPGDKEVKEHCGLPHSPVKEANGDTDGTEDERDKAAQDEKNAEYAKRKKKDPNYIPGRTVYKD